MHGWCTTHGGRYYENYCPECNADSLREDDARRSTSDRDMTDAERWRPVPTSSDRSGDHRWAPWWRGVW